MDTPFLTPAVQRVLFRLKLYLGVIGLIFLLVGIGRVSLEKYTLLKGTFEEFNAQLVNFPTLIIGIGLALTGYGALFTVAAIGAQEPPALGATKNSLRAIIILVWITAIWSLTAGLLYFAVMVVIALVISGLAFIFLGQVERHNLWQVFGQPLRPGTAANRAIIFTVAGLLVIIMAAIGVIFALVTGEIELPPEMPQPGEVLYLTTFENFNNEWDFPQGRQEAAIIDGEMVLTENSGSQNAGFYAVLKDRKFGDFDLRVRTRQISGVDDNAYGVVFRRRETDEQNYYIFEISGDGYYRLNKVIAGEAELVSPWIPSEFIYKGAVENEIRIVARKNTFTFYINQRQVSLCTRGDNLNPMINPGNTEECITNDWQSSWTDDALPQGNIGLAVGTYQTADTIVIGFDNLIITGPEAAP